MDVSLFLAIPGVLTIIIAVILLVILPQMSRVQRTLAAMMAITGVCEFCQASVFLSDPSKFIYTQAFNYISMSLSLCAFMLGTERLTSAQKVTRKMIWATGGIMAFSIMVLTTKLIALNGYHAQFMECMMTPGREFVTDSTYANFYVRYLTPFNHIVMLGIVMAGIIWVCVAVRRYRRLIDNTYSDLRFHNYGWNSMIPVMGVTLIGGVATAMMPVPLQLALGMKIFQMIMSTIVLVCFAGLVVNCKFTAGDIVELYDKHKSSTDVSEQNIPDVIDEFKDSLTDTSTNTAGIKLTPKQVADMEAIFTAELANNFFLKPEMSMPEFAAMLGTNTTYARLFLHEEGYASFMEMIRSLRRQYAFNLKLERPDITQKELVEACGYSSYSTFHRHLGDI